MPQYYKHKQDQKIYEAFIEIKSLAVILTALDRSLDGSLFGIHSIEYFNNQLAAWRKDYSEVIVIREPTNFISKYGWVSLYQFNPYVPSLKQSIKQLFR